MKALQRKLWDALSECEFAIGELEIVPLVEGWGEPRHNYKLGVSLPSNAGTVYRLYDAYQAANSIINDQGTLGEIEMSGDGSLGDIAWLASGVSVSLSGHVTEAGWEAAAQAVRSKVIEDASKLVENAFNEGFHEGMKDVTSSRGGNGWHNSKAKQALTALKDQSNG